MDDPAFGPLEYAAYIDFGSIFNYLYNLRYLNDNREARFLTD